MDPYLRYLRYSTFTKDESSKLYLPTTDLSKRYTGRDEFSRALWRSKTIIDLKKELADRQLSKVGTKSQLIDRLLEFDNSRVAVDSDLTTSQSMTPSDNYELAVETRDPEYYEYIKPYVAEMPDLLAEAMQSVVGRRSVEARVWDAQAKWKSIYLDLETLDMAPFGEFDTNFVEAISNNATLEDINGSTPTENRPQVLRFFETYPYLSYIMVQTDQYMNMAHYAILVGKLSWISPSMLNTMGEQSDIILMYVPNYSTAILLNKRYDIVNANSIRRENWSIWLPPRGYPVWVLKLARELDLVHEKFVAYYICKSLPYCTVEMLDVLLSGRDAHSLNLIKVELLKSCNIIYILDTSLINPAGIVHLFDNYMDILQADMPSTFLGSIYHNTVESPACDIILDYLHKLIVERKLPVPNLDEFIYALDLDFITSVLKYINVKDYSSQIEYSLPRLARRSRDNPKDTIAMIKLLNQHHAIISNPNLVKYAGVSKELLLYLYERSLSPQVANIIRANREAILRSAVRSGNMTAVQTVLDLLGPFSPEAMNTALRMVNLDEKLDADVKAWLLDYKTHQK